MDNSRTPELKVDNLIVDVKHSELSGYEPFYITFFVSINMKDYEDPKVTINPGTKDDGIKYYGGNPIVCTVQYESRKQDYVFEIFVREHNQHWQAISYQIHVDENPPDKLIKRFSTKPRIGIFYKDTMEPSIDFDLVCDPKVKYVKWNYGDNSMTEIGKGPVQEKQHQYRKEGSFPVTIEVYDRTNVEGKPSEERTFLVVIVDQKKIYDNTSVVS